MKPTIETFFVDIGNVLLKYDVDKFNKKVAQLTGRQLKTMQKLYRDEVNPFFPAIETSRELPYHFYQHYRYALFRVLYRADPSDFGKERVKREFTYAFFREAFGNIFTANPKICQFVSGLRRHGSKVILVSNSNPIHYDYTKLTAPQIFEDCDAFLLSHEVGVRKPTPEIWHIALRWADTLPEKVFVVDDKEENVDSAKQLGMNGAVFKDVDGLKNELKKFGFDFTK